MKYIAAVTNLSKQSEVERLVIKQIRHTLINHFHAVFSHQPELMSNDCVRSVDQPSIHCKKRSADYDRKDCEQSTS